jgi:hypothetical protein
MLFLVASPHTSSTRKTQDCGQLDKWPEMPLMVTVCGVQDSTRAPPAPQTAFGIVPSTYLICATSTATKIPRFVARMSTIHSKPAIQFAPGYGPFSPRPNSKHFQTHPKSSFRYSQLTVKPTHKSVVSIDLRPAGDWELFPTLEPVPSPQSPVPTSLRCLSPKRCLGECQDPPTVPNDFTRPNNLPTSKTCSLCSF